jgi:MarR family transcriptional regulator, transcriptional regulator for hemolysin
MDKDVTPAVLDGPGLLAAQIGCRSGRPFAYAQAMAANGVQRTVPDISSLLANASHVLAARMAEALQEISLTPRMFVVLLRALNSELTQLELGRVAGLDKTTIVVIVDELEDAGYAGRVPPPPPRRARLVRVTERGWAAAEAGLEIMDRVHQELLDALPPRQRDAFLAGLATLANVDLPGPDTPVRRQRSHP